VFIRDLVFVSVRGCGFLFEFKSVAIAKNKPRTYTKNANARNTLNMQLAVRFGNRQSRYTHDVPKARLKTSAKRSDELHPVTRIRGHIRLPGDKSISHRAALIATLASGESIVENFSTAADCRATLRCIEALGVTVTRSTDLDLFGELSPGTTGRMRGLPVVPLNRRTLFFNSPGTNDLHKPSGTLDAKNSGTTMRLLAGILASQPFSSTITGDASLLSRPMRRIADPLKRMGAKVTTSRSGSGPLRIKGKRPLQAIDYHSEFPSAQIKSGILLAGLGAAGTTTVSDSSGTRDHTERMLSFLGVRVKRKKDVVSIEGGQTPRANEITVPGDVSSAAYFIAAAMNHRNSDLVIENVGLNPTRTAFLEAMQIMGGKITVSHARVESNEPVGTMQVQTGSIISATDLEVSGSIAARLIDELPLLAFLAASVGCGMTLSDAEELRFKETDRISATVWNLKQMGALITEHADGWTLDSGARLRGARLKSFGDHRIAMSCAVAASAANGPSKLIGKGCVAISFPEFWSILAAISE